MKPRPAKRPATPKPDAMTKQILAALRRARAVAVKTARMHGTPIIYMRDGKIVSEHP